MPTLLWLSVVLCCGLAVSADCSMQDFGIAYNGNRVFAVSSQNSTCTCTNYASPGLADFDRLQARTAAIGTLTPLSNVTNAISVPVGTVLDLGSGDASRQPAAGKISYGGTGSSASLNIVGGGSAVGVRQVTVLDVLSAGSFVAAGNYVCGGLQGAIYSNLQLSPPAACSRFDPQLSLLWNGTAGCGLCANGSVACGHWSGRWSGYVLSPHTGPLTLTFMYDEGLRVWWGNDQAQPDISAWSDNSGPSASITVNTTAGAYYALRVEYYEAHGSYHLSLWWSYGVQSNVVVPSSNLCTSNAVTAAGNSSFTGLTSFTGAVFFNTGIGSLTTPTTVNGPLTTGGPLTVTGGGLFVTAAASNFASASFLGVVTALSNVQVGGALTVVGPSVVSALTATGNTTLTTTEIDGVSGGVPLRVTAAGGLGGTAAVFNGRVTLAGGAAVSGGGGLQLVAGGGGLNVSDLTMLQSTVISAPTSTVALSVTGTAGQRALTVTGGTGVAVTGNVDVSGNLTAATCGCDIAGSLARATNLTDHPDFASVLLRLSDLEASARTGLAGGLCSSDADCRSQTGLMCQTSTKRCVYTRNLTCPDTTGVFCQPCDDGLPTFAMGPPQLHLDACQRGTLSLVGSQDLVMTWSDANDGVVYSSANETHAPKWRLAGINNMPGLFFDGNDTYLLGMQTLPPHGAMSVFMVMTPFPRARDGPNENMDMLSMLSNNVNYTHFFELSTRAPRFVFRNPPSAGASGESIVSTRNATMNAPTLFTAVRSLSPPRMYIRLNSQETISAPLVVQPFAVPYTNYAYVGVLTPRGSVSSRRAFHGYISEILLYTGELSPSEIVSVETYLRAKYSL